MKTKTLIFILPKAIKTKQVLLALFFMVSLFVNACDICGCFMGITPYDNQSQISLLHRYRAFNGYRAYQQRSNMFAPGAYKVAHGDPHTSPGYIREYTSKDYESYKTYELRTKYFIHKRIELNAILPFNHNKSKEDTLTSETIGIGDPTFFIGYHLIRKIEERKFQHRLISGVGLKIPSGNYYAKNDLNERIPLLLQTGTGSVDYFAYLNYILGYRKVGFSLNAMYKINGSNYYKEKIDNSLSGYFNLFLKLQVKKVLIIPSVQSYYEYTNGLLVNNVLQKGTKMNSLLLGPGLDFNYKNIGLNLGYQFRIFEETNTYNLQNAGRFMIGLNYNFNQRKYILGKKSK